MTWTVAQFREALIDSNKYRERFDIDSVQDRGSGTYGTVFTVNDTNRGYPVAVKIANSSDAERRFKREMKALYRLNGCRHVIELYDDDMLGDRKVLILESADRSLEERGGKVLGTEYVGRIVPQVLDALEEIHGKGVYHRDLKPANVLLVGNVVKLCDFSDARIEGGSTTGGRKGTRVLIAPEVIRDPRLGERPEAERYSLGCLMYQLASGELPFLGDIEDVPESGDSFDSEMATLVRLKEDVNYVEGMVGKLNVSDHIRQAILHCMLPVEQRCSAEEIRRYLSTAGGIVSEPVPEDSDQSDADINDFIKLVELRMDGISKLLKRQKHKVLGVTTPSIAAELAKLHSELYDLDYERLPNEFIEIAVHPILKRVEEDRLILESVQPNRYDNNDPDKDEAVRGNVKSLEDYLRSKGVKVTARSFGSYRSTLYKLAESWESIASQHVELRERWGIDD